MLGTLVMILGGTFILIALFAWNYVNKGKDSGLDVSTNMADKYPSELFENSNIDAASELSLSVQFIALSDSNKSFEELKHLGQIVIEKAPGANLYRYKLGYYSSEEEAHRVITHLRQLGYSESFIR